MAESKDGQVVRQLTYQFSNKITMVQNGDKITELFYNAEGQIVGKSNGEIYTWDGNFLVAHNDDVYANESHVVGGVPVFKSDEVVLCDHLGNTIAEGHHAFESTAYGSGLENGMFTGKPYIDELNGYHFLNRTFMRDSMRWNMPDPIGFPDGANQWAYTKGDPVNNVDPMGTDTHTLKGDINVLIPKPGEPAVNLGKSDLPYTFDISYDWDTPPDVIPGTVSWDTSTNISATTYHDNTGQGSTNQEHKATEAKPNKNNFTAGVHTEIAPNDPENDMCFYPGNSFNFSSNVTHRKKTSGSTEYAITLNDTDTGDSGNFSHPEH